MRTGLVTLVFLTAAVTGSAGQTAFLRAVPDLTEDPAIRAQAVALLEQAVQVSTPPTWTNVEIATRFHVFNPAPGEPSDGEHILTVGSPWKLRRHEWIYGTSHIVMVRNGDRAHFLVSQGHKPPFADTLENTTPIDLVRFNREDVIHSISAGPDASQCINFDSVFGDRQVPGQICVDGQQHWMLSTRLGDTVTLNTKFVLFNHAFVPEHVEIWVRGVEQYVYEQTVTAKADFPADFFAVPENAPIDFGKSACTEFRPAHPLNAPQPAPLSSSPTVTDVRLQGLVGADGHVSHLRAVENLYPDLNEQAIAIVSQWTYTSPTCDSKPISWSMTFVVEFKGR